MDKRCIKESASLQNCGPHALIKDPATQLDDEKDLEHLIVSIRQQKANLIAAAEPEEQAHDALNGDAQWFFEVNYMTQRRIMLGLLEWVEHGAMATIHFQQGDLVKTRTDVDKAVAAFEMIRAGQSLSARGMWTDWYRGDRKMNLDRAEHMTLELQKALNN